MEKLLNILKENRKLVDIIYILIISLILSLPLVSKNIDIYFDDGSQHLMRAYGSYQSIKQNGTQNVIQNFTNGFGYSWNLFYGPLSMYPIIIFGIIFGSFNSGFKILLFLIICFAGWFMYKFVNELTENRNTALLAGILYMTSPYLFNDIFIRHAIR